VGEGGYTVPVTRLTESAAAMVLVLAALVLTCVGVAANVAGFSNDPNAWFITGLGFAVLAVAVSIDEQRLARHRSGHIVEEWFGRSLIVLSLAVQLCGFGFGLAGSADRDLWSVLGIILALIGLSAVVDSHRVTVARTSQLTHQQTDALGGVICAACAFGFGIFGFFTGLFGLPHAEAWLFGGVVLGVVAVAFMFDEMVQVSHRARRQPHTPFKAP